MYLNAGASQRAQGRSPGLGGRGTHRREVAPGAVASLPAGRRRPEAGRFHRTATRSHGGSLGAEAELYVLFGMSGQGLGRRSARVAASSAVAHSGRTSDCGGTSVGIVYVCAVLVSHSRCKRGLPRQQCTVHGVQELLTCACVLVSNQSNLLVRGPCGRLRRVINR